MTQDIVLVTGGARSGKSRYAEQRLLALGQKPVYIATAEAQDDEMARRIAEHRKRRGDKWRTIEEPLELADALRTQCGETDCALVDCLTLWISNLLIRQGAETAAEKVRGLIDTLPRLDFPVILVTNEVGWGIVPDKPLARQFRDLAGWTNQQMAQAAHEVVLMVAGMPIIAKQGTPCS
jgi:adenosylcobinamide kinase/adenosylcobinamide-phosphate guanylyltransferase